MDKYCTINKSNTNQDILYLLSTSFFYLEKSYKSSQRYIDGILKIIQFINSNKYYGLRIYYDKSIFQNPQYKELYQTIKSNNKITPVILTREAPARDTSATATNVLYSGG